MGSTLDLGRALIREPDVASARDYHRRVTWLAVIHPALFVLSATGLALLIFRGRFFVTLSQRSNVETLTIAFFLLFFAYVAVLSLKGAWGGLRIFIFRIRARVASDPTAAARAQVRALGEAGPGPSVALNYVIERADHPGEAFALCVGDDVASLGELRIIGTVVRHDKAYRNGSNNLFAYFTRQLIDVAKLDERSVDIVHWGSTEEEDLLKYAALSHALHQTWPRVTVTAAQCDELEARLSKICAALRDEALLPHWEFEGEHKIPIIPEPLGIVSLSRRERRVDPLSSMASALFVVAAAVALIAFFIVRPPWVPGR